MSKKAGAKNVIKIIWNVVVSWQVKAIAVLATAVFLIGFYFGAIPFSLVQQIATITVIIVGANVSNSEYHKAKARQ